MPWLYHHDGAVELPEGETIVGSSDKSDARLSGFELLPRHFAVVVEGGETHVRPFVADAVVALNGRQISGDPCPLSEGDVLEAGTGRFVYRGAKGGEVPRESVAMTGTHLIDVGLSRAYALQGSTVGIGRDPANRILIHDATASRFHAEVRCEAGGWVLHPMGSSGTKLNGHRVSAPALLEEGDEVEIAYTVLRFTKEPLPTDVPEGMSTPPTGADLEAARRPTIQLDEEPVHEVGVPRRRRTALERRHHLWIMAALIGVALVVYYWFIRA